MKFTNYEQVRNTLPLIQMAAACGLPLEKQVVLLADEIESLKSRLSVLSALCPKRVRMPDGSVRLWRAPERLIPEERPPALVQMEQLPLGSRFRYEDHDTVFVLLETRRINSDTEPMRGTIAEWRPDLIGMPKNYTQGIYSHDPVECPQGVVPID